MSSRYKKLVHFHEVDFSFVQYKYPTWKNIILTKPDYFIGCAQAVTDFYTDCCGMDPKRISTLKGSIDCDYLLKNSENSLANLKLELGFKEEDILIGTAGSPQFRKGTDLFIKAAQKVVQTKGKNIQFVWMGGAEPSFKHDIYIRSMLGLVERFKLQDNCHLIPQRKEIYDFYSSLDLYVMSSREDPIPYGMLEAMLFKTPVIAFDTNGAREVVSENSGVIINENSWEALAAGIIELIEDSELRECLGENAKRRIIDHFDSKNRANLLRKILIDLIA